MSENVIEEEGIELSGYQGAKFGMWLFLAQELVFFGGLFAAYIYYRSFEPVKFSEGSHHLDWRLGMVNTFVLLISSLTIALAVDSIQRGKKKLMGTYIWATMALASVFMIIKYFEYSGKYNHGYFPGLEHFLDFGRFLPLYFTMTALHGLHVLIGIFIMIGLLVYNKKQVYKSDYYVPVENTALYWHLVDLVWIFLFPLMYLVG